MKRTFAFPAMAALACLTWLMDLSSVAAENTSHRAQPADTAVADESGMPSPEQLWSADPLAVPSGDWGTEPLVIPRRMEGFYGEASFLYVRPTFSEAIAFARGTQTLTSYGTQAEALDFEHDSAFRTRLGYRLDSGVAEIRFTYWQMDGDVQVDGTVGGPGEFIVDPFGNLVGSVVIIDPSDARGVGTVLTGGDRIETRASVDLKVFDLEFATAARATLANWETRWWAGVRGAEVDQFYDSVVFQSDVPISRGEFFADFTGAGPQLGLEIGRQINRLSLYAEGRGALLLGEYHVASNVNPVMVFEASQAEEMTRVIPVFDVEVGASWQLSDWAAVSAGYLFQSWIDLGTSGGHFGGFFAGADDANIMSFDGLHLECELTF